MRPPSSANSRNIAIGLVLSDEAYNEQNQRAVLTSRSPDLHGSSFRAKNTPQSGAKSLL